MATSGNFIVQPNLQECEAEPRVSPKVIQRLKKSVDRELQRSGEKIHERLFKERQTREQQKELLSSFYENE